MWRQRYQAVLMVQSGVRVTEVAVRFGVSRQAVHGWLRAYRDEGSAGLDVRSRRPESSPWQAVEAAVCEMRREHPTCGRCGLRSSWPGRLSGSGARHG